MFYNQFNPNQRRKFYVLSGFFCIFLFFFNISEIKWITVELYDYLGLTSHLTQYYWIGFGFLVFLTILLYFDEEMDKTWVFLFLLFVLGLYLFGIATFAEENTRMPWSYYPAGEAKMLLDNNFIEIGRVYPLISYRSWPSTHFISAQIIETTKISFLHLIQYYPLIWVICFILIVFAIGKRLNFSKNASFLLTSVALASFWISQNYYSPQAFGFLLYLLLFMLFIKYCNSFNYSICILLLFISLVTTHLLTPIALIFSLIGLSFVNRSVAKYIPPFCVIFLIYYYLTVYVFNVGILRIFMDEQLFGSFSIFSTTKIAALTDAKFLINSIRLFFILLIITGIIISVLKIILNRKHGVYNNYFSLNLLAWIAGLSLIIPLKYGSESFERLYMFVLIPALCLIILSIKNKKIFASLVVILLLLHIPAHYGDESYLLTQSAELQGSQFFTKIYQTDTPYFYQFYPYIHYFNPTLVSIPYYTFSAYRLPDVEILDSIDIVIDSTQTKNRFFYLFGKDYIKDWISSNTIHSSLYDNGDFEIYCKSV